MFKNWQTSVAGLATILMTIVHIASKGWNVGPEDIAGITGGVGLLRSKDQNVTGGTKYQ